MSPERDAGIAAVVLAAGEARRFGGPKLTMPFGDSTVIGCVVGALAGAGVSPIVVAVGSNRAEIEAVLAHPAVQIVGNPDPSREMLSSVQVGLAALPRSIGTFIVALADQPRVCPDDISHLLEQHRLSGKGIALPTHNGKRGHPIVFGGRYRDDILSLGPDATLRDVIHGHIDDIIHIEFASDAFVRDIDTQEQYADERRKADAGR